MNKLGCGIIYFMLLSNFVMAKGVAAGTQIINVVQLNYEVNGGLFFSTSNTLIDTVDQVIELDMVCQTSTNVLVQNAETQRALTFQLSNLGNGPDHFTLIPDTNSSTPDVNNRLIYLDNGDGIFNNADTQITDINLNPDTNVTLFFVSDIPANATWQTSSNGIEARSTIGGSGIPGKNYTLSSYFAVDGYKGGVDSDLCTYELNHVRLKLLKSGTLSSSKLFTGTTIHYKIVASVEGLGLLNAVNIKDTIPTDTTYVSGTLHLDGSVLSDVGHVSGNDITVPLGNVLQTNILHPIHTVEFDVKVN